uniref:Uncharacterized protein n=1 Tax=Oryza brachyantha TaxID=4533 RepID=J3LC51_ORYBR
MVNKLVEMNSHANPTRRRTDGSILIEKILLPSQLEVKAWEVKHPGLFKRHFGRIDDNKAHALDMKIKKQRLPEITLEMRRSDLTKEVGKAIAELVE